MTERRPGDQDFSDWEKGFKQIEQGKPHSYTMEDFLQRSRELLDDSRRSGKSMFLKDNNNAGRVHFWVYPVEHWKVQINGVRSLDLESKEQEMEEEGFVSAEEIRRMIFGKQDKGKGEGQEEASGERNNTYTRDEVHQQPEIVLAEIEEAGISRTITNLGHAEFRVIPIPLIHQIGFAEEFMREEEVFTQEVKREREEIGLER